MTSTPARLASRLLAAALLPLALAALAALPAAPAHADDLAAGGASYLALSASSYETVTRTDSQWGSAGTTTKYYVDSDVTLDGRVSCSGTVKLYLGGGAVLTAPKGIQVPSGATLNVYGELENPGKLVATADEGFAGIGGPNNENASGAVACGTVAIHSGTVEAKGGNYGAGIGGGRNGDGGTVRISGGEVTATGGNYGAGIGGGQGGSGGTVEVFGGKVTSTGGIIGAGIGGGENGTVDNVKVSGGTVTATGGQWAAGIGGGKNGDGGTVEVSGGKVTAAGGGGDYEHNVGGGAGIGGGWGGDGGNVTVSGGEVTATGGGIDNEYNIGGGAGIGGGLQGSGGTVEVFEGTVTAKGGFGGAGIGGGNSEAGGTVKVSGGAVTATGGSGGAGIGGGMASGGTVEISGGEIVATGGEGAEGIGRGSGEYVSGDLKSENGVKLLGSEDGTTWAAWNDSPTVARPRHISTGHEVSFNMHGHGADPGAQIVVTGQAAARPANPEAANYAFCGWFADAAFEDPYDFSSKVMGDVALHALWKTAVKLSFSTDSISVTYGDPAFSAKLSNPSGVAVTYGSSDEEVATVSSTGRVAVKGAGSCKIFASFPGDATRAPASASCMLSVAKAASSVALADWSAGYTGDPIAYSGEVTRSGSSGAVGYSYYSDSACTKAVPEVVGAGTYYVVATLAADANHKAASSAPAKLTVTKAAGTLKVKPAKKRLSAKPGKKKKFKARKAFKVMANASKGKVTYAKVKGSKKIKVSKTGKVTVKKGLKAGRTYTVKVRVTAAATANYEAASTIVKLKVKIKKKQKK